MAKLNDTDSLMAKEKYKELGKREKIGYLWEYYFRKVLMIVLVLIGIVGVSYILRPEQEADIRVMCINVLMDDMTKENNWRLENQEFCLDEDTECEISFYYSEVNIKDEAESRRDIRGLTMKLMIGKAELIICDEFVMNKLSTTGWLCDLNTYLDEEMLKQVHEKLIFYKDKYDNEIPIAIDITQMNYAKNRGIQGEKVYVLLVKNSPNEELGKKFLEYILEQ